MHYKDVESISLWFNNLPADREVTCLIGAIQALPLIETRTGTLALSVPSSKEGNAVSFLADINTGEYLELGPSGQLRRYGRDGKLLGETRVEAVPQLQQGPNEVTLALEGPLDPHPKRFRVTVIRYGDPI